MSDCYQLTRAGLISAVSSSILEAERKLMLSMLAVTNYGQISMDQLCLYTGESATQLTPLIESLLRDGYLTNKKTDLITETENISNREDFLSRLETLSVNGKVILVANSGLVVASSGYSLSDSEYIAAIATNLVHISEQAKARIRDQVEKNIWTTGLSWGRFRALCMNLFIGSRQYSLIVGGLPDLDKTEFFDVVSFLVRRYGYE